MALLSDQRARAGVREGMSPCRQLAVALSLALGTGLAGCSGGLENPDLTTGAVAGRVANAASTGGYVYVLGDPAVTAPLAADGSFELRGVPTGAQQLVLVAGYHGGTASITVAALAPVAVRPGMRERLDRDAAAMPAAGRVVAAVRPPAGVVTQGALFSVLRSNKLDEPAPAGGLVIGELPAGTWQVTARLPGHRSLQPVTATVPAGGAAQVEVEVEIEDGSQERGCLSTGCENGLRCDGASGRCYGCLTAADCNADDACDGESHTCREGTPGEGELCELADADAKCPGGIRVPTTGDLGYCSRACPAGDADCPAGWACGASTAGPRCEVKAQPDPALSCLAARGAFGAPCSKDASCSGALYRSACVRSEEEAPGTCSAACTTTQSCADAGLGSDWTCRPLPGAVAGSQGYCQRSGG
ncbi:MAG: hypothetical protein HZB56_16515 [Deltaproteobacteria bacterium]|nr:hypothetical protein [Deltaproteobacteria bacterium]